MQEMIYDFATHSLYYENPSIDVAMFSLTINTLEIKVNEQIVCGLDRNSDLKCIYIIPTRFIGEIP